MKIIGTTQNGFILEATENELANIAGYYSKFSGISDKFKLGTEIAVSDIYKQLDTLATAKAELAAIETQLTNVASTLKTIRQDSPIKNVEKAGK